LNLIKKKGDDDVYFNVKELNSYLDKLNSSAKWYIGKKSTDTITLLIENVRFLSNFVFVFNNLFNHKKKLQSFNFGNLYSFLEILIFDLMFFSLSYW
jgi:hypothetical protein